MSKLLIQCVVVLYKCALEESETLQALSAFCLRRHDLAQQMALLIYDNSPDAQPARLDRGTFGKLEYRHAPKNNGLAGAYNEALSIARDGKMEWLLLLDQDTLLPCALFEALFTAFASPLPPETCAIVPRLMQNGKMLSPQLVGKFHNSDYPAPGLDVLQKKVTAFNSATCLRVKAVDAIGGFPVEYWLDYLDHVMFHRLQAAGGRVLILDVAIEHRLSLQHLDAEMSLERYENLLASEWKFVRETRAGGGSLIHRLRLLKRALSYIVKFKNKSYALRTLRAAGQ